MPDLKTTLHDLDLSVTPQRIAVLSAVANNPHCTAETVATAARKVIGSVSCQAIYDTQSLFTQKGLILRIQPANSPSLYERRVNDISNHLVCRRCGKTQDADCDGGHRVPFIIRWPAAIKAASQCNELVCLTFVMSTCAEPSGAELPENAGENSVSSFPLSKQRPSRALAQVSHTTQSLEKR